MKENIVNYYIRASVKILFCLFACMLCFSYMVVAQQIIVSKKIVICQNNINPVNLNKILGVSLSKKAGSWYNDSNEKVSNIFISSSKDTGDSFHFYFLVETSGVYCGLQKNDRYNVSIVISEVPAITLSEVVQPTCENRIGSIKITNYNSSYTYNTYPENLDINSKGQITNAKPGMKYSIIASNGNCESKPAEFAVNELPKDCDKYKPPVVDDDCNNIWNGLEFFQFISPNNDGKNDKFVIRGLLDFYEKDCVKGDRGVVKLMIFNRWGTKVYEKTNYMMDNEYFDGYANNGDVLIGGKVLSSGTYFYILKHKNRIAKTGYFYITAH